MSSGCSTRRWRSSTSRAPARPTGRHTNPRRGTTSCAAWPTRPRHPTALAADGRGGAARSSTVVPQARAVFEAADRDDLAAAAAVVNDLLAATAPVRGSTPTTRAATSCTSTVPTTASYGAGRPVSPRAWPWRSAVTSAAASGCARRRLRPRLRRRVEERHPALLLGALPEPRQGRRPPRPHPLTPAPLGERGSLRSWSWSRSVVRGGGVVGGPEAGLGGGVHAGLRRGWSGAPAGPRAASQAHVSATVSGIGRQRSPARRGGRGVERVQAGELAGRRHPDRQLGPGLRPRPPRPSPGRARRARRRSPSRRAPRRAGRRSSCGRARSPC